MSRRASLVTIHESLRDEVDALRFSAPVAFTYNPLDYAWSLARTYLERYGKGTKEVLFLGMNPGPFGMAQTGVPFGQIDAVARYLKIAGEVKQPRAVHPKKPVLGLACTRSEVSGQRLWSAIEALHPEPSSFFARALVLNYCPLLFLDAGGANLTPDKLQRAERLALEAVCDGALARIVETVAPKVLVGIGHYAAKRASQVTGRTALVLPHPSPASPAANRGWSAAARRALEDGGLSGLLG
jgi:single-strand selective monofunctional uracil DNA glycosylase